MKKILLGVIATALVLAWPGAAAHAAAPYTSDGNTVLLDHYDGSTVAAHVGGTVSYINGPSGLSQAADLSNGGWLKYGIPTWNDSSGTLEAWVYPKSFPITVLTLQWNNSNTPPPAGYVGGFGVDGNGIVQVSVWNAGDMQASAAIPTNTWTHIAITWSPLGSAIYLNGVQAGSSAANLSPALWSNPTYLYVGNWGNGDDFVIDELRVSDSARDSFPAQPPVATTLAATGVTSIAATLHGTVNANGLATGARFQYGSDTNYGSVTAIQSVDSVFTNVTVAAALGGLSPYGVYHFQLMAMNAAGTNYGADMVFTNLGTAPTSLTSSPLPDGVIGVSYSQTLTATGGLANYTWSLASGSLPAGLNLSAAGVISGRPTAVGPNNFAVVVAGSDGLASTNDFTLAVNLVPATPVTNVIDGVTVGYPGTYVISPSGAFYALVVTNGGVLNSGGGQVGSTGIANANYATVTGEGSLWSNSGSLFVGFSGAVNQLSVEDGGGVTASNVTIGYAPVSTGNLLSITGGSLTAANGAGNGVLDVRRGTLMVNSGNVVADALMTSNGSGIVAFNGGSLTAPVVSNAGQFGMSGGTLNVAEAFNNAASGSFNLSGGTALVPLLMNNAGTFNQGGGFFDPATFTNSGTLVISGGTNEATLFLNLPSGIVQQSGGEQNVNYATNFGAWTISGGVANLTNFVSDGSAALTVFGGRLCGTVTVGGTGSFNQLTISNGGVVSGGTSYVGWASASSNNMVLVSDAGSLWTNAALLIGGSGNSVMITNGGMVRSGYGTVGVSGSGGNNTVRVVGAGSAWNMPGDLSVGDFSGGNQLIVAEGGQVSNAFLYVGESSGGNSVTVQDAGSLLNSRRSISIGRIGGGNNQLTIANGGQVNGQRGLVGWGDNNSVLVTGAGSTLNNQEDVWIGMGGSRNRLMITNGGQLISIGGGLGGLNNTAWVSGVGSVWNNSSFLRVGDAGSSRDRLIISDGGAVLNTDGYVGYTYSWANNNAVEVSGAGSRWNNSGRLYVGYEGSANQLIVADGGTAGALQAVYVGYDVASSSNNLITVTGGSFYATNAAGSGMLDIRSGGLTVNGGAVAVDRLYATNGARSVVTLGGGSLAASLLVNGGQFGMSGGSLGVTGAFTNLASGVFNLSGGSAIVPLAMDNEGFFFQSGGFFDPALFSNSGALGISGGTNVAEVFLNLPVGILAQSGGEHDVNVATNLGLWMVSGGVANLTNFVNDVAGALTINDGAVNAGSLRGINGSVVGLNGGSLAAQTVLNGGGFGVTGGTLGVAGTFTNATGATFDLSGGQASVLGRADNQGTFTQSGGRFETALLDNNGTLTLDSGTNSAALLVNSLAGVVQQNGGEQNAGAATNYGTWTIAGVGLAKLTNFVNASTGTLTMNVGIVTADGSFVTEVGSVVVMDIGLLTTPALVNSGLFGMGNGLLSVGNVFTNTATGTFNFSGGSVNVAGQMNNLGAFSQAGGAFGAQDVVNSGALTLSMGQNQAVTFLNQAAGTVLQSGGQQDVNVATNLGAWAIIGGTASLTNLVNGSSGTLAITNATVTAAGMLTTDGGSLMRLDNGTLTTPVLLNGGRFDMTIGMLGVSSAFTNAAGGAFNLSGGNAMMMQMDNRGAVAQSGGFFGTALLNNSGTLTISGGQNMESLLLNQAPGVVLQTGGQQSATTATNFGAWAITAGTASAADFVNGGDGTLTVSNGAFTASATMRINSGSTADLDGGTVTTPLLVNGGLFGMSGGALDVSSVFTNAAGGVFNLSGGQATVSMLMGNEGLFTQSGGGFVSGVFSNSGMLAIGGGTNTANVLVNWDSGVMRQSGGEVNATSVAGNRGVWTMTGGALNADGLVNDGSGVFTVSNGVVTVSTWLQANSNGTMTLNGGSMTTPVLVNGGQFNMGGGTLDATQWFRNEVGGVFAMSGGNAQTPLADNQGLLIQSGGVFDSPLFSNAGTLTFSNGTNSVTLFLNLATGIVDQSGGVQNAMVATNLGAWTIAGGVAKVPTFINDGTGALTVSGGSLYATNAAHSGVLDVRSGTFTMNSGIVVADNLYSLDAANSIVAINGGSVTTPMVLNGGQFGMNGGTLSVSGALTNLAMGLLNVTGGAATVSTEVNNFGQFAQSGGVLVTPLFSNSATVAISGGTNTANLFLNLPGAGVWQSGGRQNATVATNLGSWLFTGGTGNLATFINDEGATLIVSNGNVNASTELDNRDGTFTLDGGTVTAGQFYLTNGALSAMNFNGGTLNSGGSVVDNGSLFRVGNGTDAATLRLQGGTHVFTNNLFINTNATLTGVGAINTAWITNAGTIAPGNLLGTLVASGDVMMLPGSTMAMQLGGTNIWEFDQFIINGTFNIAGTLDVSLLGYMPMAGDVFNIFDFNYDVGRFSQTNLPSLLPMLYWDMHALYTLGEIEVDPIEGLGPGRMHTTVLRGDGTVWGWGFNELGQVGDGTMVSPRLSPRQVVGLSEIRSASCKDHYAVALKSDGTVWTWGSNNNGQLGDGTTTNRSSPVMVAGLDDVMTAVAAGYYHSLALKWDGTVWTWGNNFNGQLGDGYVYEYSTTPVQAVGLTNVVALAAGQYHSVALDMDGTVWTWGNNDNGALGIGPSTNRMVATQVPGLTDVKAIAAGVHTTFALKRDGTLWAWGLNNKGQLGNGSTTNCLTPVQVAGLTGVRAIAAGHYHAVALRSDRTVWTWGWNNKGQLGDGTDADRSTPVQVAGFSNGVAVAAGEVHTIAAKSDGTIVSWGGGAYGQLGNGVPEYSLPPVAMTTLNLLGAPLVTTLAATSVGSSTATLNGRVIPDGWPTTAYFRWGMTTSYGSTTAAQALGSATTNVVVSAGLTGLTPYGVYHFQLVAQNTGGTVYGADFVFTNTGVVPIIATLSPLPGAFVGSAYSLSLSSSSGLAPHTWSLVSGSLPAGVTLAVDGTLSGTPTAAGAADFRLRVTGADGCYAERDFNLTVFSFGYGVALPSGVIDASYNRMLTVSGGTGPYTWAVTGGALPAGLTLSGGGVLSGTPTVLGSYSFTIQVTDTTTGVTASLPVSLTVGSGVVPPLVGAGRYHSVAMKGDGSLWSWGNNDNGQLGDGTSTQRLLPVQATSLSGLSTVSAKDLFTVALRNDGTVWACGWNAMGQLGDGSTTTRLTPVQVSGISGAMAISAGYYHTLAVRSGGSVWAWGHNSDGQLGDGTTTRRTTPVQVSGLSGATAVAAGQYHSLAAKSDGTVWAWGYNSNGQLGDSTTTGRKTPVQVSGLANVTAVAAGVSHSLALKSDGTVWAWGYNSNGQIGDGTATQRTAPVQVSGLTDVIAIAAGDTHSIALTSDGTVWAWGANTRGQLGDGTTTERRAPVQVAGFSNGATIAGGNGHTVAAKSDGTVWAWGSDVYGQLGNGTTALWSTPVQVGGLNFLGAPVVATLAATGVTSTAATLNGTVNAGGRATTALFQWGATTNYGSATVSQAVGSASTNVAVTASLSGLSAYSVFHYRLVATNSAGLSYGTDRVFTNAGVAPVIATAAALPAATVGSAYWQALLASGGSASYSWTVVSNALPAGLTLTSGGTISGTPTATGTTFRVRVTGSDALYAERTFSLPVIAFTLGGWLPGGTISGAYSQTLLATGGTGPYSWLVTGGSLPPGVTLDAGGLVSGTPTTAGTYSFTLQVTDANGAQASQTVSLTIGDGVPIPAVGAGRLHTVALKADGTVWVIGNNDNGQLGDGTVTGQLIPEQLVALSGVSTVSAKDLYSMALKQDGTVWAWGYNTSGQLGDGTTTTRLLPVQVSDLNGVTAIAAGYYHSMALRADGTVWTWGNNGSGQLGDGTITRRLTPIQVPGLNGVRAVAAGQYHSVALKSDGTVWTWGWNANGRLGDGTTTDRRTPAQVSGLNGVIAVGAGLDHCVALKADGTVWAWGLNTKGQLGDGTTTQRLAPVQVGGLAGVTAVASGDAHCVAVKGDGTVWCWGANAYGQLGDGTTTQRLTPVQVVGFSGMAPVVAGASHTIVLGADHTLWGWGSNRYGQLGVGPGITGIWPLPVQVDPVDLLGGSWAVTLPATGVAGNAATLNGSINPNGLETSVYFRWGTSSSYGNVTASAGVGTGTDDVPVSTVMTGLTPGAAYHFQLVATNSAGLAYGADMVFTNSLPSATPTAVQLLAAGDTGASSSDGLTNLDNRAANKTLAFRVSGTVAGATVSLYDGGTAIGSATAAGATTDVTTSGTATLASGAHNIVARQTQPGMAQSAASPAAAVTVDTTNPAITGAVSRKTHGSAGTFDLALALGSTVSVEPRKDGPTTIVFTFSKSIAAADGRISANEFSIGNAIYSSAAISGNTLTLNLATVADGTVVTVALSGISDLAGNTISGVSNLSVRALYGDVNRNGSVTIGDQQSVKNALGAAVTAANYLNDLNLSGGITIGDQQAVKNALGHVLASPATPPGAGGGSQQQAGTLAFSAAGYSAMAAAGSVSVTVTRLGGGNAPATVAYSTSDGTAVAGINYLSAAGTLSFAAGETSKTFSVAVLNGLLWAGEGTVNLSLSNPGDGATLGAQSSAVLTITDEDLTAPGLLRFSAAASTAAADGTHAVVTVTRTGGCAGAVSVTMATTGGTATPWTDYSPVLETLYFADGETSKTFTVPLLGNAATAGETIELDLLNPAGGASLVAPSRLIITLD
jgi:T5SS/PEP-CTERM-associated repeat protein